MSDDVRERYQRLQLSALLAQHRRLRVVPTAGDELILRGRLPFKASGPTGEVIVDDYAVELRVSPDFPARLPTARELDRRIPLDYHKLVGDLLCLGAPTAIRLELTLFPTLPTFVNKFVIPYLYGYSYFEKHGTSPYGELDHGDNGIRQHLAHMFAAPESLLPEEFLRLTGLRKRLANKYPCPCGSGRRLGRCHNMQVNEHRKRLGHVWFRDEYRRMMGMLGRSFNDSLKRSA